MWDEKFFVGFDLTGFEDNGTQNPISRVTLLMDDENYLTQGDDSGITLEAKCPHATQAMVNAIYASVKGKTYNMFTAENARLDPAAELGDGVTAGRVYSFISRLSDDGNVFPGITAPGQAELEDEYPTSGGGPMTQEFNRKVSETRSQIKKTAEEIMLEVKRVEDDLEQFGTEFSIRLEGVTARVSDAEGNISNLQLTATSLESSIKGIEGSMSSIEQKINSISFKVKGSLGDEAHITLTVGDETYDEELDLTNVRQSFADDNSAVTISAGRITFNSGTFVLNSGNIQIDEKGNLTTENGTIKGASITGGTITGGEIIGEDISGGTITGTTITGGSLTNESSGIKTVIENGVSKYYKDNYYIGQIGAKKIESITGIGYDVKSIGLIYELNLDADFLIWASMGTEFEEYEYAARMIYANKFIKYNNNNIDANTMHFFCGTTVHSILNISSSGSRSSGSLYSGSEIFSIQSSGDITIQANQFYTEEGQYRDITIRGRYLNVNATMTSDSDSRLKNNIEESDIDALSIINNINTYSFDWIQSGEHRELGFISQQIEADASSDLIYYDEDNDAYQIKEMSFIPYLVKAVQQLYNMIVPASGIMKTRAKRWTDPYTELEKEAYVAKQEEIRKQRETFTPPEPVYLK